MVLCISHRQEGKVRLIFNIIMIIADLSGTTRGSSTLKVNGPQEYEF